MPSEGFRNNPLEQSDNIANTNSEEKVVSEKVHEPHKDWENFRAMDEEYFDRLRHGELDTSEGVSVEVNATEQEGEKNIPEAGVDQVVPKKPEKPKETTNRPKNSRSKNEKVARVSKKQKIKDEKMAESFKDVTDKDDLLERIKRISEHSNNSESNAGVSLGDLKIKGMAYSDMIGRLVEEKLYEVSDPEFRKKSTTEKDVIIDKFISTAPPEMQESIKKVLRQESSIVSVDNDKSSDKNDGVGAGNSTSPVENIGDKESNLEKVRESLTLSQGVSAEVNATEQEEKKQVPEASLDQVVATQGEGGEIVTQETTIAGNTKESEVLPESPKKRKTKAEQMSEYFDGVTDKKDLLNRIGSLPIITSTQERRNKKISLTGNERKTARDEVFSKIKEISSEEFLKKSEADRIADIDKYINDAPAGMRKALQTVFRQEAKLPAIEGDIEKVGQSLNISQDAEPEAVPEKKEATNEEPTANSEGNVLNTPEKGEGTVAESKEQVEEKVEKKNDEDILNPENRTQGSRETAKISSATKAELDYVQNIDDASEFIGRHYMPFLEEIGKPLEGEKSLMSRLFGRSKFADSDVQEKNYIVRRTQEMRKMLEDLHTKFPSPSQHSRFEDQYRWVSQSLDGFLAQNGIEVVPPEETKKPTPVPVPTPDQNQNPSSDVEIIPPGETRKDVPPTPKDQSGNPIIDIMGDPEHKILKPKKKGLFAKLAASLGAFGAIAALLYVDKDIKKDHKEIVPPNDIRSTTNAPASPRPGIGVEINTETNKQNVASGEIKKDATIVKESVGQSFPEPDENDEFMKRFNFGREYLDDGVQKVTAPIETLTKNETATNQVASVSGAVEEIKKPEVKKTSKILSFAERQAQFSERGRFFREFEINFENELKEVKNSKDAKVVIDKYYGIINREITNPAHGELDIVYSKSPTTGRIDKRFVPYETIADKKMIATVAEKTSNTIANLGAKFGFGVSHETDFLTLTRNRFNNSAVEQEESLLALKKQAGDSALLQQQLEADYDKQQKAGVGVNGGGASYKVETAPGYTNDSADNNTRTIQANGGVSASGGPRVRVVNQPIGTGYAPNGMPWNSTYYVPDGGISLNAGIDGGIRFGGHGGRHNKGRIESRGGNTSANRANIRVSQANDGTGTTTINTSPVVRRSVPSAQPSPTVKEISRAPVTKPSLVVNVPRPRPSPTINAGDSSPVTSTSNSGVGPPPRSNPNAGAGGTPRPGPRK